MTDFLAMAKVSQSRIPHILEPVRPLLCICDGPVGCSFSDFDDFKLIVSMYDYLSNTSAGIGDGPISLQTAVCIYCASRPQLHDKIRSLELLFTKRLDNDSRLHDMLSAQLALAECNTHNEAPDSEDEDSDFYINHDSMKFRHAEYAGRPEGNTGRPASQQSVVGSKDDRQR